MSKSVEGGFFISRLLAKPGLVFFLCLVFFLFSIFTSKSLIGVWSLNQNIKYLDLKIADSQQKISQLNLQLNQAKDLKFIERNATERLDLIGKNDLVFVFGD